MSANVEVFIPTFNQARFVEESIQSVLKQSVRPQRILVSDDGSSDQTYEKLERLVGSDRRLEIRRRAEPSGNLFRHWNALLGEARGEYVALFHDDDVYEPNILEKQVALLESDPDLGMVLTSAQIIDEKGDFLWKALPPADLTRPKLIPSQVFSAVARGGNSFLICPSAIFRRSLFEKIGYFDEKLKQSADLEFWFRALFSGERGTGVALIDEPLVRVRYSQSQASKRYESSRLEETSDFFDVLDLYLDRANPDQETREALRSLRTLDEVHLGLNRLARERDPKPLQRAVEKITRGHGRPGGVDRLKILGARLVSASTKISGVATQEISPFLAKWVLRQTDPRSGTALRWALRVKRWVR